MAYVRVLYHLLGVWGVAGGSGMEGQRRSDGPRFQGGSVPSGTDRHPARERIEVLECAPGPGGCGSRRRHAYVPGPLARPTPGRLARDCRIAVFSKTGACLRALFLPLPVLVVLGCSEPTAEGYRSRGEALMQTQDLPAAVIELKNAARLAPDDRRTRILLAQAYESLGRYPEALKELQRASAMGGEDPALHRDVIGLLLRVGQPEKALERLQRLPTPLEPPLQVLKGEVLLVLGRGDDAAEVLSEVPAGAPGWVDAQLLLARVAWEEGERERLAELLEALAAEAPERGEVWLLQGELGLEQGAVAEAEMHFSRAAELLPEADPRPALGRARVMLATGETAAARELLAPLVRRYPGSAQLHYLQAMAARLDGDLEGAHQALQRSAKADSEYLPAQLLRGEVFYARGSHEQARAALRAYLARMPEHAGARKLLAATSMQLGDAAAAVRLLEPLVSAGGATGDPQLLMLLGAARLKAGDLDAASQDLQRGAALAPDSAALKRSLAVGHLLAGDRAGAVAELRTAVTLDPDQTTSQYLLAATLLDGGSLAEAGERAAAMVEQRPDDPVARYLLGGVREAAGALEAAKQSYRQAAELAPGYAAPRMRLAVLAQGSGDADLARHLYREILEANAEHAGALTRLALLEQRRGESGKALDLLRRARQADSGALAPRLALARHALGRGQSQEALQLAREAEAIAGERPEVQVLLARAELAAGEALSAARRLDALLEQAPKDAALRLLLGQAQAASGDAERAQETLRQAIALEDGDFPPAQQSLVALAVREGRPEEALSVARSVQAQHPGQALGYLLEGAIRQSAGDWEAAAGAYRDALEREPSGGVVVRLAAALRRSRDTAAADSALQDWLASHPEDVPVRLALAQSYLQGGAEESARDHYQRILEDRPDHPVALNNLAVVQSRLGALGNALESARRAHELAPESPPILDTYGWLLVRNDRLEQGLRLLRQAVAAAPGSRDIRYHLAAALAEGGSRREARAELESILADSVAFEERSAAEQLLASLSAGEQ